jgi:hypothetical protein
MRLKNDDLLMLIKYIFIKKTQKMDKLSLYKNYDPFMTQKFKYFVQIKIQLFTKSSKII